MEDLMLVIPTKEYEKQAINLIEEVDKADLDKNIRFSGFNSLEDYKNKFLPDYKEYLKVLLERAKELAKQSKKEQALIEEKLQKQIQESEAINKLKNSIVDASKGR